MKNQTITTLMHMENMVLGIAFGTAVSVLKNEHIAGYKGTYNHIKLEDIEDGEPKDFPVKGNRFAQVSSDNFEKIPGAPVAYWVSENVYNAFLKGKPVGELADIKRGMTTSDNDRFLRFWSEVDRTKLYLHAMTHEDAYNSRATWFPYSKGGGYRKWYGYQEYVIDWENKGQRVIEFAKTINKSYTRTIVNIDYYFKPSVGFSYITSGPFSMRWIPAGFIYDSGGPGMFADEQERVRLIACMNSKPAQMLLKILSPTINLQIADIMRMPFLYDNKYASVILDTAELNIAISKSDWDSNETSWDFKKHPLI